MNISDEAVEAAAKAIYADGAFCGNCPYAGWGTCPDCRECCTSYANAAAPYLMADAWEAGVKAERNWRVQFANGSEPSDPQNPYRAGVGE